ncbi:MAG TPA: YbaK/EbsC family protein [Solirubrobacteraceae bacterium]|jgi:prolyl-tRNA editing enzyme YbaK/EbsC (Cys-tRNA(Pro) deacylase)|nr:YbaK/EbsC family protein [Solirubrobacteraceae bacterium]
MSRELVIGSLRAAGVPFVIKPHRAVALTAETAAEQRGVRVSQIVKCMIARSQPGEVVVLLIPGDKTLKLKKARKLMDGRPLALVPPEELASTYEVTIGAISPIQFLGKAPIFMDPTVLEEELVDISSGDPLAGVELASKELCEFLKAEIADIISTRS